MTTPQHAVLVAYAYPPFPLVGSIRAERVAGALMELGLSVHVITRALNGERPGIRKASGSLVVEAVGEWAHPKHWYQRLKARADRSTNDSVPTGPLGSNQPWRRPDAPPAWKTILLWITHIPDEHLGFCLPAIRAALRALPRSGGLIYTTTPPHSAQLVGLAAQKLRKARWIAEYRDPWTGNVAMDQDRSELEARLANRSDRWLERVCLSRADQTIAVTQSAAQHIRRIAEERHDRVHVIRNGIEELHDPPPVAPSAPMRILYIGGTGGRRDPRPFLSSLAACRSEMSLGPQNVRVDFVGRCKYFQDVDLEAFSTDLGVGDLVHFTPWVDRDSVTDLQRSADLLLLLAQSQPTQVPNKLYEYLGTGLPILAFVDEAGECAEMLRLAGGHRIITEADEWDANPVLRTAISDYQKGVRYPTRSPDVKSLSKWTVDAQFSRLEGILASISEDRP